MKPASKSPESHTIAVIGGADGPTSIFLSFRLTLWLRWLLCLGGGAFMALAFPPFDIGIFVWAGLLPLLSVLWLESPRFWRSFRAGWLYGMGYYCTSFWWIQEVGHVFNIPWWLFLLVAFLPLMSIYSCLVGLWAGLAGTLLRPRFAPAPQVEGLSAYATKEAWRKWVLADMGSTLRAALGCGALWVCIEWMRANGTLGFGWNSLGMALYDGLSMAQWAEFTGTAALSFIPVATSVVLWCVFRRTYIHFKGVGRACRPWDFYGTVIVLFGIFTGGMILSQSYSPAAMMRDKDCFELPVMAVQLNQPQRERAQGRGGEVQNLMFRNETMAAFNDIQRKTVERAMQNPGLGIVQKLPAWVIWPESALGYPFLRDKDSLLRLHDPQNAKSLFGPKALPLMREQVQSMGGHPFVLFTGVDEVLMRPDGQWLRQTGMLNSMAVIPGNGFEGILAAAKQHLMPFGEYIPLAEDIEWIGQSYSQITGTQVGEGIRPGVGDEPLSVPVPGTKEVVSVIPAICYEDTVAHQLPKFARPGAQVIVNISNDAWFGESACGEQQARAAAFRCIELRRSMVRAANCGVTCAIAPNGAVIDALRKADGSPHKAGYCYALLPVEKNAGLTLYALLGDWAVVVCAILVLVVAAFGLRRTKLTPSK